METVYIIEEAWLPGAARYRIEESEDGRLVASRDEGSMRTDLIGTTRLRYGISDRAKKAFTDAALTGWSVRQVDVPAGDEPIWLLVVEGRSAIVDMEGGIPCDMGEKNPWLAGQPAVRGLTVDASSWDGSDFFLPDGQTWVLGTERVRDVIAAASLTNVLAERFEDIIVMRPRRTT